MQMLILGTILILPLVGCEKGTVKTSASSTNNKAKATPVSALQEKPGLLLIAHGAPWPKWNKPVLALEKKVIQQLGPNSPFHSVKLVFMEFAKPSVADGIEAMEAAGCDRIVVVPLLIAPSSHSHWDVPALLGLYSDEDMQQELRDEGARLVRSKLPITLTPTLSKGQLLEDMMLKRVRELSRDPQNEAVILLAHGDEGLQPMWEHRMRHIVTYICGKTGITYGDWAFVHVGQTYPSHGVPVIAAAASQHKRVLVVGCYVSMGTIGMHHRYMHTAGKGPIHMPNPLKGKDIVPSRNGLLPDEAVAQWIIETGTRALK